MAKYNISCTLYECKDPIYAGFEKNIDALLGLNRIKITTKSWTNVNLNKNLTEMPFLDYSHKALKLIRDEANYPYYTFKCTVTEGI